MAMFRMFLATPPAGTAVASVYREKRPFGPYTSGTSSGFSPGVVMEIAETAAAEYRAVRACCKGSLRVVGVQPGSNATDPTAPVVVALTPEVELLELDRLTRAGTLEMPTVFIYVGLDPASLRAKMQSTLDALAILSLVGRLFTPDERWQAFRDGRSSIPVLAGSEFAELSATNSSGGYRSVTFVVRTTPTDLPDLTTPPLNVADPVVFYQRLATHKVAGGDAIAPAEVANSWLDVATTNRLLFTFRDEWNEPLNASTESLTVVDGAGNQQSVAFTSDRQGTIVAPQATTGFFTLSISGRKLTLPEHSSGNTPMVNATTAPAHYVIHTVRPEDWFATQDPPLNDPTKELPRYTESNSVEALIDGFITFSRIVADLKKIDSSSHFFLFTNWWTVHTFALLPDDTDSTLEKLMQAADAVAAPTRALIWHHFAANNLPFVGFNKPANDFINGLTHGQSVLDSKTHHAWLPVPFAVPSAYTPDTLADAGPIGTAMLAADAAGTPGPLAGVGTPYHMGAHHAKTSVIRNSAGTVAYVGGIDFSANRLDGPDHNPSDTRFHDVHSRIVGPAVLDVAKAFVDRWSDHPDNQPTARQLKIAAPGACPPGVTCIQPWLSPSPSQATCMVQVARTFGAAALTYAGQGDRTTWATLKQAIGRAKKYIYVEDQYLTSPELSAELAAAVPRIDHLVIVIDHHGETIPYGAQAMARARFLFLKPVVAAGAAKVHVFSLQKDGKPYKIHTKVVVVDDVFATIGSANMNARGFTHDTETNVFVLDGKVEDGARKFARDLRLDLWAEHLGWHNQPDQRMKLTNVDKAVRILVSNRPSTARLNPYDLSRGEGTGHLPGWESTFDPDGKLPPIP